MKSLKKFLALALALALCFAMALPAMADETPSIVINDEKTGHTYKVYQIFTGDVGIPAGETKKALSNVKFGSAWTDAMKATTTVEAELAKLNNKDDAAAKAYATDFYAEVKDNEDLVIDTLAGPTNGKYSSTKKLAPGYYLVIDTTTEDLVDDSLSDYLVEILDGTVNITPKKDIPDLKKTIATPPAPGSLTTVINGKVYSIGDEVPFLLSAEIPVEQLKRFIAATKEGDNVTKEATYVLKFKDSMGPTFTLLEDSFALQVRGATDGNNTTIGVTEDMKDLNANEEWMPEGNTNFIITIDNLFDAIGMEEANWPKNAITEDGPADYVIVDLTYKAILNESAYVQGGKNNPNATIEMKNTAKLEYSNDPKSDGTGDGSSESTEKEIPVYTFSLNGKKVDGATVNEENPKYLAGAEFELYTATVADDGTVTKGTDPIKFIKTTDGRYIKMSVDREGDSLTVETIANEDGSTTQTATLKDKNGKTLVTGTVVTTVTSNDNGDFVFEGLGEGDYVLHETKAPEGYNTCNDRWIKLAAKDNENATEGQPQKVGYIEHNQEIDKAGKPTSSGDEKDPNGTAVTVLNNKGTLLPSTGGIGTTIFYAVGGALVVGAGILLFVKKRMGSKG